MSIPPPAAAPAWRTALDAMDRPAIRAALAVAGTALVAALPLGANGYIVHVATLILVYLPLTLGQNLITGNSGMVSMGQAALSGTAAYLTAILAVTYHWPTLPILVVSAAALAVLGFIIGLPAIRISGDYLFIVTIGVNLVFLDIVVQWVPVTGGPAGMPGIPVPSLGPVKFPDPVSFYYYALATAAAAVLVTLLVVRSRFGTVVEAVRDDPIAAQASGISVTWTRVAVFMIGSVLAGIGGVAIAYFIGFVGPDGFGVSQSLLVFEMAILGGLGSIPGSIVGTVLLIGIPEVLRPLQPYQLGLGGLAVIILMVRRPSGIMGKVKVTNLIRQ